MLKSPLLLDNTQNKLVTYMIVESREARLNNHVLENFEVGVL